MLGVIAKLPVREGKVEEAIAAIQELMPKVAQEEGTLTYTLNRTKAEPNTLVFIERYKDKDALAAHSSTPHFQEFFAKAAGLLAGEPEITVFQEIASI